MSEPVQAGASAAAAPTRAFDGQLADHLAGDTDRHRVGGRAGVVLTPITGRAILNLRAAPQDPAVADAVRARLGLALPGTVFGSADAAHASAGPLRALWIGPGDWLVTCADGHRETVEVELRGALHGASGALTDVGHGHAVLNLSGPNAVDVLAQGCGLDLHPAVFDEGHCAMTGLARMRVVIHRLPRGGGYDVYVARSFADSLWHFVTVAAMEFGYRVGGEEKGKT